MHYDHGDASLNGVITKMAQVIPGSNNLPLLLPGSEGFGTVTKGRAENSAPRYIKVKFNHQLADCLFPRDDEPLLNYLYEDGDRCEPEFYIPVLPMAILESETTTGTGWKIDVWARDYKPVIKMIRDRINNSKAKQSLKSQLWSHGTKWKCWLDNGKEYCAGHYTWNSKTETITVDQLPIKVWSYPYKCWALGVDQKNNKRDYINDKGETVVLKKLPYIKSIQDVSCENDTRLEIKLEPGAYQKIQSEYGQPDPIINWLSLQRSLPKNLNMIEEHGYVKEFSEYDQVLDYWFDKRKQLYQARIKYKLEYTQLVLDFYQNKLQFILADSSSTKKFNIDKDYSDEQVEKILKSNGFKKFNDHLLLNPGEVSINELKQLVYQEKETFYGSASFNYIKNIKISEKSKTGISKLQEKIDSLNAEIEKYKNTTWQVVWLEEIKQAEKIIDQGVKFGWIKQKPVKFV